MIACRQGEQAGILQYITCHTKKTPIGSPNGSSYGAPNRSTNKPPIGSNNVPILLLFT